MRFHTPHSFCRTAAFIFLCGVIFFVKSPSYACAQIFSPPDAEEDADFSLFDHDDSAPATEADVWHAIYGNENPYSDFVEASQPAEPLPHTGARILPSIRIPAPNFPQTPQNNTPLPFRISTITEKPLQAPPPILVQIPVQNPIPKIVPASPQNTPDLWRIETFATSRTLPAPAEMKKCVVRRWTPRGWEISSLNDFYKTCRPENPICIYVHGNRTDSEDATLEGLTIKNLLPTEASHRLVVWNWDTQRLAPRVRVEYREKAASADLQGVYLAYFLKDIPEKTPTTIIGYSFGARCTLNALHLCGGGTYAGFSLQKPAQKIAKNDFRTLIIAAATESSDLSAGGRFPKALDVSREILLTVNPADPALRLYPQISNAREKAIGTIGAVLQPGTPGNEKIIPIPVNLNSHLIRDYFSNFSVRQALMP